MGTAYVAARIIIGQTLTEFVEENFTPVLTRRPDANFIDMQSLVNDFTKSTKGKTSVVIYDVDTYRYSAIYNSDATMDTASLYKLFPVYETYLRMEDGRLAKSDVVYVETKNNKRVGYSREKCADLAIRESHSGCAESLVSDIGWDELDQIGWDNYGLENTKGFSSTANDIAKILKVYYEHDDLSTETWNKIKDSMLNQPSEWRQGLPSGFHSAKVYNKVGWLGEDDKWKIYNDAAIIEFPDQRRTFIVVVMTTETDPKLIANFGEKIEQAVITNS
ncbi:serine hydrolase [Candidatus Saccharibacteria bacterium]|nr:serine hydrolase [Candidatus Saccharibacteria bacterium]